MGGNGSSGSGIYAERPTGPAPRPNLYADSKPYGGLESYQTKPRDPLARKPGQSLEAWRRDVLRIARALPDDVVQATLAAIDAAEAQGQAAVHPSQRVEDMGILGMSPADRAALVQQKPSAMTDLDSRSTPMSSFQARQAMHEREMAQRNAPTEHTDVSQLRSTGQGWLTR